MTFTTQGPDLSLLFPALQADSLPTEPLGKHVCVCLCVCIKSLQLCLTLCDLMDHSPPGSSIHEILPARILEWVAMLSSSGSPEPRNQMHVSCGSCIAGKFFYRRATREAQQCLYCVIPLNWAVCYSFHIFSLMFTMIIKVVTYYLDLTRRR